MILLPLAVGRNPKSRRFYGFLLIFTIFLSFEPGALSESFTFSTPAGSPGQKPSIGTTGDGTNNGARFKAVSGLCVDAGTNVYVTDAHAVRKMSRTGTNWVVTTLAGNIDVQGPQDGTNAFASFNNPQGVAVDSSSVLFVADTYNHTIRRITNSGTNWSVITIAGLALTSGINDGSNNFARFNHPFGISVDSTGTLFVTDSENQTIRKIVLQGTNWAVTTVAGAAGITGNNNGTNNAARFNGPIGITVDNLGNFYTADSNNHTIRKGSPSGTNWVISTIVGLAGVPGSNDGTNANARFSFPQGLAIDSSGNLYVSESGNNTIRKIRQIGTNYVVNTLGGLAGAAPGSANGTGAAARFNDPYGLGIISGTLFVADSMNDTIRSGQVAALLEYRLSGNKFVASWPVALAAGGYVSESSVSLGGVWTAQSAFVVTNGDTCFLTNTATIGNSFYRLRKP